MYPHHYHAAFISTVNGQEVVSPSPLSTRYWHVCRDQFATNRQLLGLSPYVEVLENAEDRLTFRNPSGIVIYAMYSCRDNHCFPYGEGRPESQLTTSAREHPFASLFAVWDVLHETWGDSCRVTQDDFLRWADDIGLTADDVDPLFWRTLEISGWPVGATDVVHWPPYRLIAVDELPNSSRKIRWLEEQRLEGTASLTADGTLHASWWDGVGSNRLPLWSTKFMDWSDLKRHLHKQGIDMILDDERSYPELIWDLLGPQPASGEGLIESIQENWSDLLGNWARSLGYSTPQLMTLLESKELTLERLWAITWAFLAKQGWSTSGDTSALPDHSLLSVSEIPGSSDHLAWVEGKDGPGVSASVVQVGNQDASIMVEWWDPRQREPCWRKTFASWMEVRRHLASEGVRAVLDVEKFFAPWVDHVLRSLI